MNPVAAARAPPIASPVGATSSFAAPTDLIRWPAAARFTAITVRQGDTISGLWQESAGPGRSACRIAAGDNRRVVRVDVLLNGALLNREFFAPWAYVFDTTTIPNGQHRLDAVAYDAAGNSRTSTIFVNVRNDANAPPPPPLPSPPRPAAPITNLAPIGAPAPSAGAAQPPLVTPLRTADLTAPLLTLGKPSRSLRLLRRSGAVLPFACFEQCVISGRLLLSDSVASRLGVSRLIGAGRATSRVAGQPRLLRVVLRPRAKRLLAKRAAFSARLSVVVTDTAGNRRVRNRSLVFVR